MLTRASRDRVGTCDACAEGDKPLPYEDGDAWICRDCHAADERAIEAATNRLVGMGYFGGLTPYGQQQTCRKVARIVVNAYLDAHSSDGDQ